MLHPIQNQWVSRLATGFVLLACVLPWTGAEAKRCKPYPLCTATTGSPLVVIDVVKIGQMIKKAETAAKNYEKEVERENMKEDADEARHEQTVQSNQNVATNTVLRVTGAAHEIDNAKEIRAALPAPDACETEDRVRRAEDAEVGEKAFRARVGLVTAKRAVTNRKTAAQQSTDFLKHYQSELSDLSAGMDGSVLYGTHGDALDVDQVKAMESFNLLATTPVDPKAWDPEMAKTAARGEYAEREIRRLQKVAKLNTARASLDAVLASRAATRGESSPVSVLREDALSRSGSAAGAEFIGQVNERNRGMEVAIKAQLNAMSFRLRRAYRELEGSLRKETVLAVRLASQIKGSGS